MKRSMKALLTVGALAAAIWLGSLAVSAAGQAQHMAPAFEVFPGTVYDTPFTHSYAGAHGTVVVPAGNGKQPDCLVVGNGLKANTSYTVYYDINGSTAGSVATAGPWVAIGTFETNGGGNGQFRCTSALPGGVSIYVNETAAGLTVLISGNLP